MSNREIRCAQLSDVPCRFARLWMFCLPIAVPAIRAQWNFVGFYPIEAVIYGKMWRDGMKS